MANSFPGLSGLRYSNSLNTYSRFLTREVLVGNVGIGAHNPVRIQSMTTTDTMDTMGTVEQTLRMVQAGCELVRITAPSVKEAENLRTIRQELHKRGCYVPLVADIHFTPNAAEVAARIVEKVRVNPGNYADKKKFEQLTYTDSSYNAELERIRNKFIPLVRICKEYGTAMRIGTNHGSLSDRIMSQYGDTPAGMVESAMEFLRICEDEGYYNLVISMKASNTQVMVQAYRLLNAQMINEGMNYPLHLGVTEAGDGEDGRIKSAVGIGTLLEDGLGDTIRVSLTEDPEAEMPVARMLAERYERRPEADAANEEKISLPAGYNPYAYIRRTSSVIENIGGGQVPVVVADVSTADLTEAGMLTQLGYRYNLMLDKYDIADMACDYLYTGDKVPQFTLPGGLKCILNYTTYLTIDNKAGMYPMYTVQEFLKAGADNGKLHFIQLDPQSPQCDEVIANLNPGSCVILVHSGEDKLHAWRPFMQRLEMLGVTAPVIFMADYSGGADEIMLAAATDMGAELLDGYGDGLWITRDGRSGKFTNETTFGILQAARVRISKTEYISCPSCGRTLFDLQQTTQAIREKTSHLKGVKIGIMGCIVNGPGEMADADYGYVGAGEDKITLYRGKEVIKRNVKTAYAIDSLIELIKEDGRWAESQQK